MRPAARDRIPRLLAEDDLVLDVGGWAVPYPRATHVLDLAPYETRGTWGYDGDPEQERFTGKTWTRRDVCDREPWPYADGQFAFAICSHTLEDVRDPVWVCQELQRVARAGYVEVPSRLEEQCWGVQGPWVGWGHHHWLIDVDDEAKRLEFVFKHHTIHASGHLPAGVHATLTDDEKVSSLWWTGAFEARERVLADAGELTAYLAEVTPPRGVPAPPRPGLRQRLRRRT